MPRRTSIEKTGESLPKAWTRARLVERAEGHGPRLAIRPQGRRVDLVGVLVRVREQGLGGGDHAQRLEARDVGAVGASMCSTRWRRPLVPLVRAARS
jgi:hypothetical protein